MAKRGIELNGIDGLLAELRKRSASAVARVESRGLQAAGEVIREEMANRAPRSDEPRQPTKGTQSWRTGLHAAEHGIKVSRLIRKEGAKYVLIGIQKSDNSKYFYLKFFEWGTSKMPAQPWAEPSFHAKKKQALEALADELRKGLR